MKASTFEYRAASEADTARLGRALAETLPVGSVVGLSGTLGAGKTRLVKSILEALGIDPREVVSPTFVLMQQYEARRTVCHLDAYRIKSIDELLELGLEEMLTQWDLVLIEWAEKAEALLPADRLNIEIDVEGPQDRLFRISGLHGEEFIAQLAAALAKPA